MGTPTKKKSIIKNSYISSIALLIYVNFILHLLNFNVRALEPRAVKSPKLVFAHFIVGLTINYTQADWKSQCQLAASHGIDAFALNVGLPADWQLKQVQTAYDAVGNITTSFGNQFKLFLSLDMSVIQTAQDVQAWAAAFSSHPSQLMMASRPLISTFAGELDNFGSNNVSTGWQLNLKKPLQDQNPSIDPLFIPAWTSLNPMTAVSDNPVVDGIMNWDSWPIGTESLNTRGDIAFQTNAQANQKLYMAGVSPCFFTHYGDKNWIYRSDDNLYINRWIQLISLTPSPDLIEIISWNDYGESHYIGPKLGTPPQGTTWLDGFDHAAWLDMSDYFIAWYKTGSPPPITQDAVYINYRPHSVRAVARSDPLPSPTNASLSTDAIYGSAFLSPSSRVSTIQISIGSNQQTFSNLNKSGLSTFMAPWSDSTGDVQVALLDDSGNSLMKKKAPIPINNNIDTYNFNYATLALTRSTSGGSADRPPPSVALLLLTIAMIMPPIMWI